MKTRTKAMILILSFMGIILCNSSFNSSDAIYEEDVELEEWMTETFTMNLEDSVELEEWMLEPFEIN